MHRVIERFDPKTVSHRKQTPVSIVPYHKREFTAQVFHTMRSQILVQVQRYLAIRSRPKPVTAPFQLSTLPLKIVELAVYNDAHASVFVGDRLIPGSQIDNA